MVFISITRLRVRSWRFMPGFFWYALRSSRQAQRSAGFLTGKLVVDAENTFWTVTAWQDEAAMRAYRGAVPHGDAMRKLARWCNEASVAHRQQESTALPTPAETHRYMVESGRPSRVDHPSANHTSGTIPSPRVRMENPLPAKAVAAAVRS